MRLDPRRMPAPPRDLTEGFWAVLAGTRFLLATWVLFAHTANFGPADRAMPVPSSNALVAVYGFLAVSGFSIHHSIAAQPTHYAARRFARIVPSHLASLAIAALAYAVCGVVLHDGFGNPWPLPGPVSWLGCALLLQAAAPVFLAVLFPSWSLSIEVMCYALAPALRRAGHLVPAALIIASGAFCFVRPKLSGLYVGSDTYGLSFAAMLWAWLAGWFAYGARGNRLVFATGAAVGAIVIAIDPLLSGWFNYACWAGILAFLCFGRIGFGEPLHAVARYLGDLSYPLYIVHYPVLFLLYNAVLKPLPDWNYGIVQVAVVLAVSAAILRYVDRPGRARIASRFAGKGPTVARYTPSTRRQVDRLLPVGYPAAMKDDPKPLRPHVDPIEVPLVGDGPFQLPICTDLKEIAVGESLAVLRLETIEGQRLDIPVPIGMLIELQDGAEEALHSVLRSREGSTVQ